MRKIYVFIMVIIFPFCLAINAEGQVADKEMYVKKIFDALKSKEGEMYKKLFPDLNAFKRLVEQMRN